MQFANALIDHLHAWHIPGQAFAATDYTRTMNSIHFYDSIVLIEKKEEFSPGANCQGRY